MEDTNGSFYTYQNESGNYSVFMYDETYDNPNTSPTEMPGLQDFIAFEENRNMFKHFYHTFAALIVISNVLMMIAILVSKKQRRHFRNWLILNLAVVNILIGGVSCPFAGHKLTSGALNLGTIACKLTEFVAEALTYMTNVSIAVLGFYHLLSLCSSRLLNGVSNALLTAIMIATPWVIALMMTAVLRLAMSDEEGGRCYTITGITTQTLWLTLGILVPLLFTFVTLLGIIVVLCFSVNITADEAQGSRNRRNVTVFVIVCLAANIFLQAPHSIIQSDVIAPKCTAYFNYFHCIIGILLLDQVRLFSMVLIPLVYLIPNEMKRLFLRTKRLILKSVDSARMTKSKRQQQPKIELNTMKTGEKPLVGTT